MTPALRLAISLVLSLLLWLPTLPAALRIGDAPEMIALRYLLALVVARVGVGLVFRIVNGYAAAGEEVAEEPAAEDPQEPLYGRRRDDWEDVADLGVDSAGAPTEEELLDAALEEAQDAAALT